MQRCGLAHHPQWCYCHAGTPCLSACTITFTEVNKLPPFRTCCRDCWAQEPGDRPSMAAVVPRLRALLEGLER